MRRLHVLLLLASIALVVGGCVAHTFDLTTDGLKATSEGMGSPCGEAKP